MTRSAFTFERILTDSGLTDYNNPRDLLKVDDFINGNPALYFTGDNGSGQGSEIYFIYDGGPVTSPDDTDIVLPGGFNSTQDLFHSLNYPKNLTVVGSGATEQLFFTGAYFNGGVNPDAADDVELWVTTLDSSRDATQFGVLNKLEINPNVDVSGRTQSAKVDELTKFNGQLYFRATDGTNGVELWRTTLDSNADGVADGTEMVADIYSVPNDNTSNSTPTELTPVTGTNRLYFKAFNKTEGNELWVHVPGVGLGSTTIVTIDGTNSIYSGSSSSNPANLTVVGNTLFFVANNPANGRELWKVNSTTLFQAEVINIRTGSLSSNPTNLTGLDGTTDYLFFTATDGTSTKLFQSGVTNSNPVQVANSGGLSDFSDLYVANGKLFFSAKRSDVGVELWEADPLTGLVDGDTGTSGYQPIVQPYPGATSSSPSNFSYDNRNTPLDPTDDLFYFTATGTSDDAGTTKIGKELWRFNPTSPSTTLQYADIYAGNNSQGIPNGSLPNNITPFNDVNGVGNTVYFQATGTDSGGNFIGSALFKATS